MDSQLRGPSSEESQKRGPAQPIAVLGMGCRLPGGINTPSELWTSLVQGRDSISEVPAERWDLGLHFDSDPRHPLTQHVRVGGFVDGIDQFDPAFFGVSPREADCMDPQHRLLLEVAWRAIEDGGQPLEKLRGNAVGVFMGISTSDYRDLLWAAEKRWLIPDNEPFVLSGNVGCVGANRISYLFDLHGPSFTLDTACSSSLVAVHLACESLWRGESELALAGGVQALIHPGYQTTFCKAGLLSPEGRCRSFDAAADGYVRSEGAGAVLLKPLSAALRDGDPIQALIRGTAVNSDGRSRGMAHPSKRAQVSCVRQAYHNTGLNPSDTQYVEAHGTGTRLGDPIEARALGEVLGHGRDASRPCRMGSVKSNLGHAETAAGITGFIKTVLCLREQQLPPSLHFQTPNPSIDFAGLGLQVQTKLEPFPDPELELVAGVSSFGFGGTNAHAVLSQAPVSAVADRIEVVKDCAVPSWQLLWLTARSSVALEHLCLEYAEWIEQDPTMDLHALCASTHRGRSRFNHARGFVFATRSELLAQLNGLQSACWSGVLSDAALRNPPPLPAKLVDLKLDSAEEVGSERLEQFVEALARGAKPNWEQFHRLYPYQRMSVPGHPFLRQRCWWTDQREAAGADRAGTLWVDHLGITGKHSERGVPETNSGLHWQVLNLPGAAQHLRAQLDPQTQLDLKEHCIRDHQVFPAAGHLAMAVAWQKQKGAPLQISSLELDTPLRVGDATIELQAVLQENQFEFYSRAIADGDIDRKDELDWLRHGRLKLTNSTRDVTASRIPEVGAVPAESLAATGELGVDEFYSALSARGLTYGPSYRPIQQLWRSLNGARAQLSRVGDAPDRTLIDGCFQLVAAALPAEQATAPLLLPVGLERLHFEQWPLPNVFHCHARLRTETGQSSDDGDIRDGALLADLQLANTDGTPLGVIEGLQLRRVPRAMLDMLFPEAAPPPGPDVLECLWQPLESADSAAPIATARSTDTGAEVLQLEVSELATVQDDCQTALEHLFSHVQQRPLDRPLQLTLIARETSVNSEALRSALRSLALERPAWQCSWLQLPPLNQPQPTADQYIQLQNLAQEQAEIRWLDGVTAVPRLQPLSSERFQVMSNGSGRLDDLQSQPLAPMRLMPGELELRVEATGLNFRDVLNALGLLQAHSASLGLQGVAMPIGGEAIGRVVAVGSGVDPDMIGNRMLAALTVGSLASHVAARAELCVPWPENLSVDLGASVSTAYLTAIYGLETLAQLKQGETVLVHAAAGGVGMAALRIAQRCGARILATASSAKQATLLEQPGVEAVFDSRSTAFAEQVLSHTSGRGVDVVLNSLKGDWVDASFRALAQGGRFVELGKIEVWSTEQVREQRPDAKYLPFDLLEVAAVEPEPLRQQLLALVQDLESGTLASIPYTVFPMERCQDAFRLMAQGRHVGKLVIRQSETENGCQIVADGTYLVTGAFGAIGLQLMRWLSSQGASSLLLVSRHADRPSPESQVVLDELEQQGVRCRRLAIDLSANEALESEKLAAYAEPQLQMALAELSSELPLRGIFHAAGVLRDRPLNELVSEDLSSVIAPKLAGWQWLERTTASCSRLEFVVAFSSVAALFGSPGQVAYAAANGAVEASLCLSKRVPLRLAIQWGPWAGPGMAAGLESRFANIGMGLLEPEAALSALGRLLRRGYSGVVTVLEADWARLALQAQPRQQGLFAVLVPDEAGATLEQLRADLLGLSVTERNARLLAALRVCLAQVMECDAESLDAETSLFDLGLDSLMGVELEAVVKNQLGFGLNLESFRDDPSLADLARSALEQVLPESSDTMDTLDLGREATLPDDWRVPEGETVSGPGEVVLLTGASGFLGAYLMAGQLRRWPQLRLRCLVRCASAESGLQRLENNLRHYGLWEAGWTERIEAVPADLALPRFGLNETAFEALVSGVSGILHNGAQLSQMATYAQLAAANVGSTRELLRLATLDRPVRLELISSVAVFEADAYRNRVILESDPIPDWQGIHVGYSQTKWVSDQLVVAAGKTGLPITVYRPPLIGGAAGNDAVVPGHWHEGDLLQRLLQGSLLLGQVPLMEWELDAVPVNYVADAVTALAWSETARDRCFHLQHPDPILVSQLLQQFQNRGVRLQEVAMEHWLDGIAANPENPLHPLHSFLRHGWGADSLNYFERNARGMRARQSCDATLAALEPLGVQCPTFEVIEAAWSAALLGS